ncbi:hypothetical protein KCU81_g432, partial [Aureobasidium melanogenum]
MWSGKGSVYEGEHGDSRTYIPEVWDLLEEQKSLWRGQWCSKTATSYKRLHTRPIAACPVAVTFDGVARSYEGPMPRPPLRALVPYRAYGGLYNAATCAMASELSHSPREFDLFDCRVYAVDVVDWLRGSRQPEAADLLGVAIEVSDRAVGFSEIHLEMGPQSVLGIESDSNLNNVQVGSEWKNVVCLSRSEILFRSSGYTTPEDRTASYTSVMNCLTASSVWALVGLLASNVLCLAVIEGCCLCGAAAGYEAVFYSKSVQTGSGKSRNIEVYTQSVVSPLYFFDDVETAVNDELVHVSGLITEASNAVSSSLGSAKFMFEKRIVSCADDGEIV